MTNEERHRLIEYCQSMLDFGKNDTTGSNVELWAVCRIALESLQAEPVAYTDAEELEMMRKITLRICSSQPKVINQILYGYHSTPPHRRQHSRTAG